MQLHMQELANVYNAMYPPQVRVRMLVQPMSDANTIADAVVVGFAGIIASLTLGLPVIVGASVGLFTVGVATYLYACANPGIKANDFDEAVADSAWVGAQVGAAGDPVTLLKIAELPVGLSPYGFIAGGVIGAVKYLTHKYYPYAWVHNGHAGHEGRMAGMNPSYVAWQVAPYITYGVTATWTGIPCNKIGC